MINLSSRSLVNGDLRLLSKGLSFCPTARFQNFDFEVDMFKFERMLKIKQHFHTVPKTISTRSVTPFKLKSTFFPSGHFRSIDSFIQTIKHDARKNVSNKTYTNLSPEEFIALRTLKEDKSIIIKPADKDER